MMAGLLALDTIISATLHATSVQTEELQSNRAFLFLRYLLYSLYQQGHGNLMNAQLRLAQTSLAMRFGLSRRWIGELARRLEHYGWIIYSSEKLHDGTNGATVWRIGPKMKALLIALRKSQQRKTATHSDAKSSAHFFPLFREKKVQDILAKEEKPPSESMLNKIPLLRDWLKRGKAERG